MSDRERVPLREAAWILGMSPQGVREHMKRNMLNKHLGIDGSQAVSSLPDQE